MAPDILATLDDDASAAVAQAFTTLAVDYLAATRDRSGRVSTAHTRAELAARFTEPLPRHGHTIDEIVARLRDEVLPDSNHLYHPRYIGHQVSAPLPAAIWTEALTAALNNSMAVWEMSPVATVLEHQVIRWLTDLAGYGPAAGGTLTTGGTEATFTALLAARAALLPDSWTNGIAEPAPLLVCGEHSHYAVTRAAGALGLGLRNVRLVPSVAHRMDPSALFAALDAADRPVMAVVATAGSTATGSFDDLQTIGEICTARGIWLHIDGAHGASALLSSRHRHRLRGIELADSIALDPHKMMLLPLQAGTLLVRNARVLDGAFAQQAPYLFHGTDSDQLPDLGVRSFLCSRRADVLKLWVALQRYGADGLGELFDHLCDTARAMYDAVCVHPAFEPVHEPECNIVCFRHVGSDELNRDLRERYNRSGAGWITTTMLGGRRVLRATIMNPRTTGEDVRAVVEGVGETAKGEEEQRAKGDKKNKGRK
jgi:L-2,4-diaminobutyrate decarboxylase